MTDTYYQYRCPQCGYVFTGEDATPAEERHRDWHQPSDRYINETHFAAFVRRVTQR